MRSLSKSEVGFRPRAHGVCVCVCVCESERKRDKEKESVSGEIKKERERDEEILPARFNATSFCCALRFV